MNIASATEIPVTGHGEINEISGEIDFPVAGIPSQLRGNLPSNRTSFSTGLVPSQLRDMPTIVLDYVKQETK